MHNGEITYSFQQLENFFFTYDSMGNLRCNHEDSSELKKIIIECGEISSEQREIALASLDQGEVIEDIFAQAFGELTVVYELPLAQENHTGIVVPGSNFFLGKAISNVLQPPPPLISMEDDKFKNEYEPLPDFILKLDQDGKLVFEYPEVRKNLIDKLEQITAEDVEEAKNKLLYSLLVPTHEIKVEDLRKCLGGVYDIKVTEAGNTKTIQFFSNLSLNEEKKYQFDQKKGFLLILEIIGHLASHNPGFQAEFNELNKAISVSELNI